MALYLWQWHRSHYRITYQFPLWKAGQLHLPILNPTPVTFNLEHSAWIPCNHFRYQSSSHRIIQFSTWLWSMSMTNVICWINLVAEVMEMFHQKNSWSMTCCLPTQRLAHLADLSKMSLSRSTTQIHQERENTMSTSGSLVPIYVRSVYITNFGKLLAILTDDTTNYISH